MGELAGWLRSDRWGHAVGIFFNSLEKTPKKRDVASTASESCKHRWAVLTFANGKRTEFGDTEQCNVDWDPRECDETSNDLSLCYLPAISTVYGWEVRSESWVRVGRALK